LKFWEDEDKRDINRDSVRATAFIYTFQFTHTIRISDMISLSELVRSFSTDQKLLSLPSKSLPMYRHIIIISLFSIPTLLLSQIDSSPFKAFSENVFTFSLVAERAEGSGAY